MTARRRDLQTKRARTSHVRRGLFAVVLALVVAAVGLLSFGDVGKDDTTADSTSLGDLVVHFIDVGQGDSTFIEFPDGSCMLIDAGYAEYGSTVVSYIESLGYTRIDYLVATHPHADHIGGMAAVIDAFDIGEIWAPDAVADTAAFENFLDAAESKDLGITVAEAGETIVSSSAGYSVAVCGPASTRSEDLNDCSVIVLVEYGDTSFLFTGDASAGCIPAIDIDVLKVSHHGSNSGTTVSLLSALTPSIAVISYGLDNSYGHPTQSVLDLLASAGADVYGTGANGTVVVVSDGSSLSVRVSKTGTVTAGALSGAGNL